MRSPATKHVTWVKRHKDGARGGASLNIYVNKGGHSWPLRKTVHDLIQDFERPPNSMRVTPLTRESKRGYGKATYPELFAVCW